MVLNVLATIYSTHPLIRTRKGAKCFVRGSVETILIFLSYFPGINFSTKIDYTDYKQDERTINIGNNICFMGIILAYNICNR